MADFYNKKSQKLRRKELRFNSTKAEKLVWAKLRNREFLGLKFRRQYGIGSFIVDFYCHELRLIIEIDGAIHGEGYEPIKDKIRENFLKGNGFYIKRYTNDEIVNNMEGVLIDLEEFCKKLEKGILVEK